MLNSTFKITLLAKFQEQREKYLISFTTGMFLFVVLYLFKAYDIQQGSSYSGASLGMRAMAFALLTSFVFAIHEFYIGDFLDLTTWKRKILWRFWEVFAGAHATFLLFNYFWNGTEWFWESYFLLIGEYYLVMSFPIAFVWIWSQQKKPIHDTLDQNLLVFRSENGKEQIKLKTASFLYLKSEDNYIKIVSKTSGKLRSVLLRTSLKNIENTYSNHPNLKRCHRSYIVNPKQINQVFIQSRQIKIDIGEEELIPVSKTYQEQFY